MRPVPEERAPVSRSRKFWLSFIVVYACLLGVLVEGGARLLYVVEGWVARRHSAPTAAPRRVPQSDEAIESAGRALGLDPYEIADLEHPGHRSGMPPAAES